MREPGSAAADTSHRETSGGGIGLPKRIHYAWIIAGVTFLTLLTTAGIRSTPGDSDRAAGARIRLVAM